SADHKRSISYCDYRKTRTGGCGYSKNIAQEISGETFSGDFHLPGYQPTYKPNPMQIRRLADALASAKRPVLLAGAGVHFAGADRELLEFAEKHNLPVTTTLLGLGSFPGEHKQALGMAG